MSLCHCEDHRDEALPAGRQESRPDANENKCGVFPMHVHVKKETFCSEEIASPAERDSQ